MNNRIWIISDTHFGHKNVIEFEKEKRPFKTIEEHDECLISNWNEVVKVNDTVWHLGDVLFGQDNFYKLAQLNGRLKLVMGNHDQYPMEQYMKYFVKIVSGFKFHDTIFSHIPIHSSQFFRFKQNIHGHLHSSVLEDSRYVNVSVEQTKLYPVLLDEVLFKSELHNI